MGTLNLDNLRPGDMAELSRTISESDVYTFAGITGDLNPVHIDAEYAKGTLFGERVAHGILSAGLISAVLGTRLPGPGAIYLSQNLKFLKPVRIGDTITARAIAREINTGKRLVTMATSCTNQHGVLVAEGESVLLIHATDTIRTHPQQNSSKHPSTKPEKP